MYSYIYVLYVNYLSWLHSAGELRTPSISIPKGTIVAVCYTFTVYALIFIVISATCERSVWLHSAAVH